MIYKKEYGDYQTPLNFTKFICELLASKYHLNPDIIIEPTCGTGNFLKSSLSLNASNYLGIEINKEYCKICRQNLEIGNIKIINDSIFNLSLKDKINKDSQLLILGNPPWATNSNLSRFNSNNLPVKYNIKNLSGIEAMTGSSNFDISEAIIIKLIEEFLNTNTTLALLCKTSTARNIFLFLKDHHYSFSFFDIHKFKASKVWNVDVSACLMVLKLTSRNKSPEKCSVFELGKENLVEEYKYSKKNLTIMSPSKNISDLDGISCFKWHQGIKHDCVEVMELTKSVDNYINKRIESVDIENEPVFPLIKSSAIKKPVINNYTRFVIIPQHYINQDTTYIKRDYPKLWKYLNKNKDFFDRRKSRIYKNKPDFSIFGVGDYTFSKYKVAISGFKKIPLFTLLLPDHGKAIMVDDTCYYLNFDNFSEAYLTMLCLNSDVIQSFLKSISFRDLKRPFTKKVLERINFKKALEILTPADVIAVENAFHLENQVKESDFIKYRDYILSLLE